MKVVFLRFLPKVRVILCVVCVSEEAGKGVKKRKNLTRTK